MNLINKDIKPTGNYWCSWRTQSTALENEELRKKGYNLRNMVSAVFFDYIVHVFIASAGKADEDRTVLMLLGIADGKCHSVGTFNSGDDSFIS